jgi:hypothetical protein
MTIYCKSQNPRLPVELCPCDLCQERRDFIAFTKPLIKPTSEPISTNTDGYWTKETI